MQYTSIKAIIMIKPLYARYIPPKSTLGAVAFAPLTQVDGESLPDPLRPDKNKSKKRKRNIAEDAVPPVSKSKKSRSTKDNSNPSESKSSGKEHRTNGPDREEVMSLKPLHKNLNGHGFVENREENPGRDRHGYASSSVNSKSIETSGKKRKHKAPKEVEEKSYAQQQGELGLEKENSNRKHSKVFSKFVKATGNGSKFAPETNEEEQQQQQQQHEEHELHDLVPLPLPKQHSDVETLPKFSALPQWLAQPVAVPSDTTATFDALGLQCKLVEQLKREGYTKALPVQAGVLPLLLPLKTQHPGDLCVSAATGSGKTLAYVLPLVQILQARVVTELRAVIIVPTRELVIQVRDTAEMCTRGTDLQIGIAVGSQSLKIEQEALVNRGRKFDPDGYEALQRRVNHLLQYDSDYTDDDSEVSELGDAADILPGHVLHFTSKVDILICTPGRLVDHIRSTKGFTLDKLDWLVIDEADRLLDQSFQEWTDILVKSMETGMAKKVSPHLTDDPLLSGMLYPWRQRHVRKIVLSATMTRDLDKLNTLKLRNPKMVIVEGTETYVNSTANGYEPSGAMSLPLTLQEYALPVEDGSDKPLYLLQLLLDMFARIPPQKTIREMRRRSNGTHRPSSPIEEGHDCSESDVSSKSSSDTSSDTSSRASSSPSSSISNIAPSPSSSGSLALPSRPDHQSRGASPKQLPSALIFTSSNESAHRLLYILTYLHPPFKPFVAALTKSTTSSQTAHILSSFRSSTLRLLIATDRASRGLDLPDLDNVINYDIPRSTTSYVHRVGRTARAEKEGKAWTLVDGREAAWFWKVVARGDEIERGSGTVNRVRVGVNMFSDEMKTKYAEALEGLKRDVEGKNHR